ncbi:hypothetical protein CA85_49470 [Allorhodopirellula solitaria]|uniref:Uncharacterized protein n=1 Tax=Allorhodopirellula solitaria TaxID=2527987 RepID=A0A5C5WWP7_9BACT|nr:hypothetical protein CA85_49470 [Allorhodopirellula solitaria]
MGGRKITRRLNMAKATSIALTCSDYKFLAHVYSDVGIALSV